MNFATLKGLTIPEGKVIQITDSKGFVLFAERSETSGKIILDVKKVTSDTYSNSTTYTGEEFILLKITPKAEDSVINVTYGGLTKTFTFDSTYVYGKTIHFGTFGGVSDEVETPSSGTLTIDGDCTSVGIASYSKDKSTTGYCSCVTGIIDFGNSTDIPAYAYTNCKDITSVIIPDSVTLISTSAFNGCEGLKNVTLTPNITKISSNTFNGCSALEAITILSGVTNIETGAFNNCTALTSVTIPSSIASIGANAFSFLSVNAEDLKRTVTIYATTPPTITSPDVFGIKGYTEFVVPAGCGDTYKTAKNWSELADYITEASA